MHPSHTVGPIPSPESSFGKSYSIVYYILAANTKAFAARCDTKTTFHCDFTENVAFAISQHYLKAGFAFEDALKNNDPVNLIFPGLVNLPTRCQVQVAMSCPSLVINIP
jgi:hypothetical protein